MPSILVSDKFILLKRALSVLLVSLLRDMSLKCNYIEQKCKLKASIIIKHTRNEINNMFINDPPSALFSLTELPKI